MKKYYFDLLPIHPQPLPLEAFTSYISRLSEPNNLYTSNGIAQLLFTGTTIKSRNLKLLADFPLESFGLLPTVSGCSSEHLLSTTFFHLNKKFGRKIQNTHKNTFLRGAVATSLRYCPYCLASQPTPYYSLLWRFVNLYTCPDHNSPLLDHCTHCQTSIPLFTYPSKIPFCVFCKKDLRLCIPTQANVSNEQKQRLSVQELKFILSPDEREIEDNISFLLHQRLTYKAMVKETKIIAEPGNLCSNPRKLYKEEREEATKGGKSIRIEKSTFLDYFNCTRQLGITFNDLFSREFFNTISPDPEEQYRQLFVMSQQAWEF